MNRVTRSTHAFNKVNAVPLYIMQAAREIPHPLVI